MDYRKFGDAYYVRMDRGDEIVSSILAICEREGIRSATFWGIGGCSNAEIQVFSPENGTFETERVKGMLELVSLMATSSTAQKTALRFTRTRISRTARTADTSPHRAISSQRRYATRPKSSCAP